MNSFERDFREVWNGPSKVLARIIIINVAVWLVINVLGLFGSGGLLRYLMLPSDFHALLTRPWTIVTTFFTHVDFWHIFQNMLVFYWFAQVCLIFLGGRKVISLYMLGGLAGSLAYLAFAGLDDFMPVKAGIGALGASAAVNALVTGAATIAPEYRFHLLFIGPVKIKYIALVMVVLSLFNIQGNTGSEVAHLAGAFMGFAYIRNLREGSDWGKPVHWVLDRVQGLFSSRKRNMQVTYRKKDTARYAGTGVPPQAVVDAILDKIHASGFDKLTEEERQILSKASQKKD